VCGVVRKLTRAVADPALAVGMLQSHHSSLTIDKFRNRLYWNAHQQVVAQVQGAEAGKTADVGRERLESVVTEIEARQVEQIKSVRKSGKLVMTGIKGKHACLGGE